ncbi:MAG: family 20 glycosylhydrolase, partial [Candidatus Marinimicrobia bacterium]|nr:family 20 glycosylhydrolase [Candidatus Neomarinimicrobiota bacterium]
MNSHKKSLFILLIFSLLFSLAIADNHSTLNLMPVPQEITQKEGKYRLDEDFTIDIKSSSSERLHKYATRVLRRLTNRTGLFIKQGFVKPEQQIQDAEMIITAPKEEKLQLRMNEEYTLTITEDNIILTAPTDIGAMRGLETFLQLLDSDGEGYFFPQIKIKDEPRFAWRGLLIDVSRHFEPVHVIKRNLDGMAAMKMNVLHWHLCDDQGFRVESKTYPKLHEEASGSLYYTQEQIKDIIEYARNRGIRILPEFDVPSHATSFIVAYPKLGSQPNPPEKLIRTWGIKDPSLNPAQEFTYQFLDKFFGEMAELFPDNYFHIGGDENNGVAWKSNPDIQNFMEENNISDKHALQAYFNNRVLKILTNHGKKMVGWEEILHKDMPQNIVIQAWRSKKTLEKAVKSGYQAILSRGYYIDLIKPTDKHYLNEPIENPDSLSKEEKNLILGGEATMWGEFVTEETIDSRIWPRTAAIAERFWSSADVRDLEDMYRRLEITSYRLEELGLTHIKNYPMMLRRLTRNGDISPLRTLVDVLEPVKIYRRNSLKEGGYYQYSPYSRVVDAARPDQKVAREFNNMVDDFLDDPNYQTNYKKLKYYLKKWDQNHEKLQPVIASSPILQEINPASANLEQIAQLSCKALEKLHKKHNTNWLKYQFVKGRYTIDKKKAEVAVQEAS